MSCTIEEHYCYRNSYNEVSKKKQITLKYPGKWRHCVLLSLLILTLTSVLHFYHNYESNTGRNTVHVYSWNASFSNRNIHAQKEVVHFVYGLLPTMNPSRKAEPLLKDALYLKQECGQSSSTQMRFLSSKKGMLTPSNPSHFPWLVQLKTKDNKDLWVTACGGAFVAPKWIISAQHCYPTHLQNKMYLHFKVKERVLIEKINRANVKKYPDYDNILNRNDFMMIKTNGFRASAEQTICLPNINVIPSSGRYCLLAGQSGGTSKDFWQAWIELDQPWKCQQRYSDLKYDVNYNICDKQVSPIEHFQNDVQERSKKCYGLSGSPLICKEFDRWVAYGVLNWSAQDCDYTGGRGYALTSTRLQWICCKLPPVKLMACLEVSCNANKSVSLPP